MYFNKIRDSPSTLPKSETLQVLCQNLRPEALHVLCQNPRLPRALGRHSVWRREAHNRSGVERLWAASAHSCSAGERLWSAAVRATTVHRPNGCEDRFRKKLFAGRTAVGIESRRVRSQTSTREATCMSSVGDSDRPQLFRCRTAVAHSCSGAEQLWTQPFVKKLFSIRTAFPQLFDTRTALAQRQRKDPAKLSD